MPKVKNLAIKRQSNSKSYYASWAFSGDTITKTSNVSPALKVGAMVKIKSGAKWYNGVSIPSWVMSDTWKVYSIKGDRVVINQNASGNHRIMSPIKASNLIVQGSGSSTSTTTTSVSTLDHYEVKWFYDSGDGVWFSGGDSTTKETYSIYSSVPDNALRIKITVKPVSKKKTENGKEVSYWTGTSGSVTLSLSGEPPETPPSPTVKLDKYTLTAKVENVSDARTDKIQFEVYNGNEKIATGTSTVQDCETTFSCNVTAGGAYRVRCRAVNIDGNSSTYSEYTPFTSAVKAIPSSPSGITEIRATSETSVYVAWNIVNSAETYELQYTTEKRYFDGSDSVNNVTGIENNYYEKTGLETGDEYFFRVRAVNEQGSSDWSDIKSVIIGDKPSAPTTWSSSTTIITGEPLVLYWIHNSEDGSSQIQADLEIYVGGIKTSHTIVNSTNEDDKDKTSRFDLNTSTYTEGTVIEWRVRTAGVTMQYGDWSTLRRIDVYAPPTLQLKVTNVNEVEIDTINSFPFYISGFPGPRTQTPIGYHVAIISNDVYESIDAVGNPNLVNSGDVIYSNYFDTNQSLLVELSASNIDLANGITYTITCVLSMDSGLTATTSTEFSVSWDEESFEPEASVYVDDESYIGYITPFCRDEEGNVIEGVSLSVYRREYDGRFTEIAKDIINSYNTTVIDPHPALDYARYRIVSTTLSTGAVSYYDVPGYPVNGSAIIIQWDEDWIPFDSTFEAEMESPPWNGSLLKLPYNIDTNEANSPDVAFVEYIGRSYPVSYYGTHLGETTSWNVDIVKEDIDTIYALRRLQKWMGDVYVREPSGVGYWANILVSFSQKHRELTVPVTLSITRVEGGA